MTRGQEIGRTGNSGSSTGPHLHFHLINRPSALAADGLPYEFDRFTVTGRGPGLQDLLAGDPATTPIPIDPATAGPRTDQLPLSRDVVDFPVVVADGTRSPSSGAPFGSSAPPSAALPGSSAPPSAALPGSSAPPSNGG